MDKVKEQLTQKSTLMWDQSPQVAMTSMAFYIFVEVYEAIMDTMLGVVWLLSSVIHSQFVIEGFHARGFIHCSWGILGGSLILTMCQNKGDTSCPSSAPIATNSTSTHYRFPLLLLYL